MTRAKRKIINPIKTTGVNRSAFAHALTLARYNLPLYIVAAFGAVIGLTVAWTDALPFAVRFVGGIVALTAAWYACASFFAFHLMFDRSNLLSGEWLHGVIAVPPRRWAQLSICLEETTLPLEKLFPFAEGKSLDLFDSAVTTESAIARARQASGASGATAVAPDALPVADDWADLVVVTLAAHEVRDGALRKKLFGELRRIASDDGIVIVVEHLRNAAAFAAFGPLGFLHFYPRKEWLQLAESAHLELCREFAITPFVRVFAFAPAK